MAAEASKVAEDLQKILELGSKADESIEALNKVFALLEPTSVFFAGAGIILDLISVFLPDKKQEQIMQAFEAVLKAITDVERDIKELENIVIWEATKLQYAEASRIITQGMSFCQYIQKYSKSKEEVNKKLYVDKLMDLCLNAKVEDAVNALIIGLKGGDVLNNNILDAFYNKSRGDRPQLAKAAGRLMQLVIGGINMVVTYTTLKESLEAAHTYETNTYHGCYAVIDKNINFYLQKCKNEFSKNIQNDLSLVLDDNNGKDNRTTVNALHAKVSKKYDWLIFDCMVYNNVSGFDKHEFTGDQFHLLHYTNKCAIAFYKDEKWSDELKVSRSIMENLCKNASGSFIGIKNQFDGIEYYRNLYTIPLAGLACWKRFIALEAMTSNQGYIWQVGRAATVYCLVKMPSTTSLSTLLSHHKLLSNGGDINSSIEQDITATIDAYSSSSNRVIVNHLHSRLSGKYDLLFDCMTYNDIYGSNNHTFNGDRVQKLHYKNKCAIAFYKPKSTKWDYRQELSRKFMQVWVNGVLRAHEHNMNKLYVRLDTIAKRNSIEYAGLGCWKRYIALQAKFGNVGEIWYVGNATAYCLVK